MAGNASEFLKAFESLTERLQKLVKACLRTSTFDSHDPSVDAARAVVEMQWKEFANQFASHPHFDEARCNVARVRARLGDDFFYDWGNCKEAIKEYEASLALDPNCMDALSGIVAVYLQGTDINPAAALPYAIRRAELDPAKQADVEYVRQLLKRK